MSEDIKNEEIIEDAQVEESTDTSEEIIEDTTEEVVEEIADSETSEEIAEEEEIDEDVAVDEAMHDKKKKMMKAGYHKEMDHGKKKKMMKAMAHKDPEGDEDEMKEYKKKMNASYKVAKEDIDVKQDVDAMLQGQDLSEEFQEKVETIFEAAVLERVNEKLESVVEEVYSSYESDLQENVSEIRQELSEKVDEYLSYVAKEYVAENKLAIENKLKLDIMENFMSGLKKVFEENYVDVPEEKVDLYGEALESLEEKESKLNEQFEKNIKLSKNLEELEKEIVLRDVTDGLTTTQVEKVRSLSENLEYSDREDMMQKVTLIKENYFPSETTIVESAVLDESALETSVEDSPVVQEENKVQSVMDIYAQALNRPKD